MRVKYTKRSELKFIENTNIRVYSKDLVVLTKYIYITSMTTSINRLIDEYHV